jgi:hypothetical protein
LLGRRFLVRKHRNVPHQTKPISPSKTHPSSIK